MKKLLIIFVTVLLTSCNEQDQNINYQIVEGTYQGYFMYNNKEYWSSIQLGNGNYTEWPSGGIYYQKPESCLSVGEYSIDGNKLTFNLDIFKFPEHIDGCIVDMILSGEYNIVDYINQDSLIFKKGSFNSEIVYHLKLEL